ncbi:MAG: hypothetical protein EOP05_21440 [Proteobacteria bacterium]|nr:MAG: hypothetical protein EOP05_21440 [Pseudomonadota bacterium]
MTETASDAAQNGANAFTAMLGGISYCDDSGLVSSEELSKIDACTRSSFHGNLGDITKLAYFSEQLILNDLADEAEASVDCHLPFFKGYLKSVDAGKPSDKAKELSAKAFAKFSQRSGDIATAYKILRDLETAPPGSYGEHPSASDIEIHQKRLATARLKLNALTVDMPLGTTEPVRQQIYKLASNGIKDEGSFNKGLAEGIRELKDAMTEFKTELSDG